MADQESVESAEQSSNETSKEDDAEKTSVGVAAAASGGSVKSEVASDDAGGHKPLSHALRYFYGVGDFGFNLMSSVETYYFVFFLTNLALFDPATAALIAAIGSGVDAVLGWMYGGFINSLKPMKWGRYRSWLFVLPWVVPILFAFEFTRLTDNVVFAAAMVIFFNVTSHMAWDFPYVSNVSMIAVAGSNASDRARLAATRGMWSNAAKIVFSYLVPPLALVGATMLGQANQYAFVAFFMGVCFAILYYIHFRMFKGYDKEYTKEELDNWNKTKQGDQGRTTFKDLGRALFTNPPLISLMLADIAKWVFNFMCAGIAAYYFTYVVFNPAMLATYIFASNVLCVVGSYLSARFARAMKSTRNATVVAFLFMAVMLVIARATYTNMWVVVLFMSLAQFGYGITYSCTTALYSDTVVYSEWKTGKNAAGWISGLQLFPLKIGFIARGVAIPAVLAAAGWATQYATANTDGSLTPDMIPLSLQQGICTGFMVIPAILLVIAAVLLFFGYRLTPEKLKEYQDEIDARKAHPEGA